MPARDDVRVLDLAGGETTVVSEHEAVTVQASPSPVFVMVPEAPNSGR
jgi:hypothetical protein